MIERTENTMSVTDVQDPRSLIRVLMRGDRATQRHGELGTTAAVAACEQHDITLDDGPAALELLAYAYGFAVGLNDDWLLVDHLREDHAAIVREGYEAGLAEDPTKTLPAGVGDRKSWDGEALGR